MQILDLEVISDVLQRHDQVIPTPSVNNSIVHTTDDSHDLSEEQARDCYFYFLFDLEIDLENKDKEFIEIEDQ